MMVTSKCSNAELSHLEIIEYSLERKACSKMFLAILQSICSDANGPFFVIIVAERSQSLHLALVQQMTDLFSFCFLFEREK